MEAVPRLPMISFHLKVSPEPTSFGPKLKQYIRDFYNEDAESYTNEIHQLESLRAIAVRPPIDMAGCLLLKKYYCQLHFLQSRFPMAKDGAAAVTFTWRDVFANMVCSLANIRFEIISILYNIGSMHTQLGARTERTSTDGMKMACAHFQCAAWAFEHLKNNYLQPPSADLASELMTFMHQLCLAQAQECILEKSMLDNRKPTIVAKVAKQIVDYFTLALNTLEQGGNEDGTISDAVGTKIYKSWKRYVKFKKAYHCAVTYLYQGLAAEEQRKMGERVAFYNAALASLNEAHGIYTNAKGSVTGVAEEKAVVKEALTFTNDVIEGKRKAAKNENEFIYHEEVPEKDALPTVKGACLVKGISFSINDPEVSGPDIFARLVPMKVHEASSLYSEEKAKILRCVGAKIEEKDQQLNTYLTSLKLEHMSLWDPDIQTTEWERLPLPEELVERCAALNAKQNVIQELVDVMRKLSETSEDVETVLKEIKKLLLDEEQKEKQYQDTVGKRPPSIVATDLTREAKKYEEAHNKALESNQALHKAVTMHVKNLKVLAQPLADLAAHVPNVSSYLSDQSDEKAQSTRESERLHTKELKRILNKVDEMRMQRSELHAKLRDSIAQDDLTRLLVTATSESGPLDRLFADQLSKHQTLVNLIEQNLAAQDNILTALTDAYAQTANVRKGIEDILKRRELTVSSLIASYDAYEDLLAKSNKGLEFYRKLEINVSKLLQRVKSTCKVQDEEREQILAQDNKNSNKTDATAAAIYEPGRPKTGSGLKLKDYLNNRSETGSIQNQYYNVHKNQVGTLQADPTKAFPTDLPEKNFVQPPVVGSTSEDAASASKWKQKYYPTDSSYAGYRINSPYSVQTYPDNPSLNVPSQSYMQTDNTDASTVYQQPNVPRPTVDTANTTPALHYPVDSYLTNGQYIPKPDTQYNVHNTSTMQYGTYPMNYGYDTSASTSQEHSYTSLGNYVPNQNTPANVINSEASEAIPQMHYATQAPIPTAVTGATGPVDSQQHPYITQQKQQYGYEPQQPSVLNQESDHSQNTMINQRVMSTQSYGLPQSSQSEMMYPANYHSAYYGVQDLQNQQIITSKSVPEVTNYIPSTQYLPTQHTSSNAALSTYATAGTSTATVDATATPYPSTSYSPGTVTYKQDGNLDPTKQNYTQYNSQTQVNANAMISYPNAYQGSYQHNTPDMSYQQSTSTSYPYGNCVTGSEIIQSHTKPATAQNYSQAYQYPHQNAYAGYNQEYVQRYNYMLGMQGQSTLTESYDPNRPEYTYGTASQAPSYQYNSSGLPMNQGTQLDSTAATSQIGTAINTAVYQQQESNARYTNASNNAAVSQTSSSQYSVQAYPPQGSNETYYTTPYGLQMQFQGSTTRSESQANYSQTYVQAVNNGTSTTTSSDPVKLTTKSCEEKPTSNVDLLSDLDITINHAPLVPEVRPLNKTQKEEEATANDLTVDEKKEDQNKEKQEEPEKISTTVVDRTENENLQIVWDTWYTDVQPKKDPLGDPSALQRFISDVEKYEKFVDSLLVKTLSGATNLDIKWKEVQDFEERENGKQSSTVASAHSSENRAMECIPYDTTRVQISSPDVSSYINASHIAEVTQWIPTAFIVTQAPISDKFDVFWTMIWEQESEVIACLASDAQLNGEIYWPTSEENALCLGNFEIALKKTTSHASYVQRILSVHHVRKKAERIVVHMQFFAWPSNGFPSSPGALLAFSTDVMTEQALRRCSPKPVIVHCIDGGSLSSLFLMAAATVCHIRAGCGIVDVPLVFKGLVKCRKQVVNKESLLFAYRLVLYHAQDILMKRGILSSSRSTFENFQSSKEKALRKMHHPSDDFLHSLNVNVQRPIVEQKDMQAAHKSASTLQEKPKERVADPLSQLDPLWSIRK